MWAGFDDAERRFLTSGFQKGFSIPATLANDPPKKDYQNHASAYAQSAFVNAYIQHEIQSHRIAGPFVTPPLPHFIMSPLGVVPKKDPGQFRIIHDLSFPRNSSVNSTIDPSFTHVTHELLDDCVNVLLKPGPGSLIAKADIKNAFRIIPIDPKDYRLLGFQWQGRFFYDKVLPMGCSVSCNIF